MTDSAIPEELRYSEQDEWTRADEDRIVVGITDYAQQQLGDIVFVELPEVGTMLSAGAPFGVIESVKAVADLFAPISGEVIEVNDTLESQPEIVNADCYGAGWILSVRAEPTATDELLDAAEYAKFVNEREEA